ncbi:hypothetical protein P3T39_002010 [Kitasatospora sp. GP82]|nr:hypothetical protein [Kitasatospora sp. GP82]
MTLDQGVPVPGPQQKPVLTTTVTDAGVAVIDGDRARLLIFADQRNTGTADNGKPAADGTGQAKTGTDQSKADTAYPPAMFAVDAIRQDGAWKIADIDTFGR